MSNREKTYQLINDYLKGKLSFEEKNDFEKKLTNDQEFKRFFEKEKIIFDSLYLAEIDSLRKTLSGFSTKSNNRLKRKYIIGGICLILGAIIFIIFCYSDVSKRYKLASKIESSNFFLRPTIGNTFDSSYLKTESKDNKTQPYHESVKMEGDTSKNQNESKIYDPNRDSSDIELADSEEKLIQDHLSHTFQHESDKVDYDTASFLRNVECELELTRNNIIIVASCKEYGNGKVIFKSKNVKYSINDGLSYYEGNSFNKLLEGNYQLKIKDTLGCESNSIQVLVESYPCNGIISYSQFKYWKPNLKVFKDEQISIQIFKGRSGILVEDKIVSTYSAYEWNGIGQDGSQLPVGNYIYFLKGKSSGRIVKGEITILD